METDNNTSTNTVPNEKKSILATLSLVFGIFGLLVPYPTLVLLGMGFLFLSEKIGADKANSLQLTVPLNLSLVSLVAILLGALAYMLASTGSGKAETSKKRAIAGMVLGLLTLLCVSAPLWFGGLVAVSTSGG